MTHETSMAAYEHAVASGLVTRRRAELLKIVAEHGPITASEAFNILKARIGPPFNFDSNTNARFTELRGLGVIVEAGTRPCNITGRTAIVWASSGTAPVRAERKPSMAERMESMEARIDALQGELLNIKTRHAAGQLEMWGKP